MLHFQGKSIRQPSLPNATAVSMNAGVFEAQPHLRTIFLQIQKLHAVKSSTPFLSYKLHCIFIFHSTFISARATSTGVLPRDATQWAALQRPGSSRNFMFTRPNPSSTIWLDGDEPASKGQSRIRMPSSYDTRAVSQVALHSLTYCGDAIFLKFLYTFV